MFKFKKNYTLYGVCNGRPTYQKSTSALSAAHAINRNRVNCEVPNFKIAIDYNTCYFASKIVLNSKYIFIVMILIFAYKRGVIQNKVAMPINNRPLSGRN